MLQVPTEVVNVVSRSFALFLRERDKKLECTVIYGANLSYNTRLHYFPVLLVLIVSLCVTRFYMLARYFTKVKSLYEYELSSIE